MDFQLFPPLRADSVGNSGRSAQPLVSLQLQEYDLLPEKTQNSDLKHAVNLDYNGDSLGHIYNTGSPRKTQGMLGNGRRTACTRGRCHL